VTLLEPAPVIAVAGAPTPGGPGSWKWQLRDKNGRWIQMGSEVSFSHNGKTITGIIVGSPKEGYATVKLADGSTATVATAGVTSTGKSAGNPTPGTPKAPGGPRAAGGENAPAVETQKQVKAVAPGLKTQVEPGGKRKPLTPAQKRRERKRSRAKRRRERESGRRKTPRFSGTGGDTRLAGIDVTSKSIEAAIRAAAKKKGRKDPFADEKERGGKPKDGGPKDGKGPGDTKGAPEKGGPEKKPRKDTRKKLTQSQIDAVGDIMKDVLAAVKKGSFSSALAHLDKAEKLLKDTSAPWLSTKIHFLQKGLKGIGSLTASGAPDPMLTRILHHERQQTMTRMAAAIERQSALVAAGDSWRWQLRDSKGQWIEMGSKVKWMANGLARSGTVIGSPDAGSAIVEDEDGNKVRLTTNRLSLVSAPPVATGQPQMVSRREQRAARRQERKAQKATFKADKQTPAMAEAMQDMADNIRDNVAPENQAAATEATVDVIVGEVASNLPKRLQLLERVKALKEKGLEAQIRLAVYFQVREAHHKHLLKAQFWANEFLGDMGATDNPTPSWAAIPTLIGLPNPASNPVEFLTESSKMISQLLKAASSLVSSAVTAAGDSWRWQLRDKDGQWIKMGSRISWLLKGALHTGTLVGSPKEGTARIRDDETGRESNLLASRLTALPDVGSRVRYTAGKNPKGMLAEVIGLPEKGKVTIRDLRTGKEKDISEATVKVVDVEEMPPAVGDRKYMTPPPPVGGLRIVEAKSSMTSHNPSAQDFINNDGGTLADPKHLRTNSDPKEGEPPAEMTASMSVLADHFTEVLHAAQAGIPYSDKADPAEMDAAPFWYERAHQTCLDLLKEFGDDGEGNGIPGLTIEKVTGVMAAMSPRTAWPVNIIFCKKILAAEADPEFRKIPTAQAKSMMEAGNNTFTEDSLQILRGEGTPQGIMGGLKRRSFWNSMLDPSNDWDVCIDGWMASGYRRVGLTYLDGTPLDKEGLKWLDDGAAQLQMEDSGAGYVITADAVRIAAARVGLTPLQAQAMYWVSVGGGAKGAKMWTDPPSENYLAWRQEYLDTQVREREARLEKALLPMEVAS